MDANDEKFKFQYEGLRWLREHEFVNHPQLINNLKMNILMVSTRIKEVELLISQEQKAILVYLELSWMGKKFSKKNIVRETEDVLSQLLPSFKFRITEDPKLFALALEKVRDALTGGKREVSNTNSNVINSNLSSENNQVQRDGSTDEPSTLPSNLEEQPKN